MRFKGLDLNLLVAFDGLVRERSVTLAAERLHLSQPAMSAALSRLRDYLDDDILRAVGKRMVPTPYAERLHVEISDMLQRLDQTLGMSASFDPVTSERSFRIAASDYIAMVLLVPLVRKLAAVAPHIHITIINTGPASVEKLGRGEIDLVITPRQYLLENHPSELLMVERHVVVGWREHPAFKAPMTQDVFCSYGQIGVEIGSASIAFAQLEVDKLNARRTVELIVPSFTLVGPLLVGTRRLALMHERLARLQATMLPLAIAPNPFPIPLLEQAMQWHRTRTEDPGIRWLRSQVAALARTMPGDEDHPSHL